MKVTVYTTGPSCQACRMTKKRLTDRGIAFTEVLFDDEPESTLEAATYLGFTTAPVVCVSTSVGEVSWDGYRPDRIDALAGAA